MIEGDKVYFGKLWTAEESSLVERLLGEGLSVKEIQKQTPGRSHSAVQNHIGKIRRAKIRKPKTSNRNLRWSSEDLIYLHKHWGVKNARAIARVLGRSLYAVHNRANQEKLGAQPGNSSFTQLPLPVAKPTHDLTNFVHQESAVDAATNRAMQIVSVTITYPNGNKVSGEVSKTLADSWALEVITNG